MKIVSTPLNELKLNEDNPRKITREKLERLIKSIKDFPQMLQLRPIVVDENNVVLGGNMRLQALEELGYTEVPTVQVNSLTEAQKREFIIKDNLAYGEWDWEVMAVEWDNELLEDWGLDLIGDEVNYEELGDSFSLPSGEKPPFRDMNFTFSTEQAEAIENAIKKIKQSEDFKNFDKSVNKNSNGNALYLITQQWEELKKL